MLALSIGAIVATAVYGTFHTAIKAKTRAEAVMTPLRTARYFFSAIKADLQHIPVNTNIAALECSADHCTFPIYAQGVHADAPVIKVCYRVSPQKELIREEHFQTAPGKTTAAARQEIIGSQIRRLGIDKQVKMNQDTETATALITITVSFACKPDPVQYHYAMLVEQTLQP